MSELLGCPNCDGSAIQAKLRARRLEPFFVKCLRCGSQTAFYTNIELAIAAWNTRAPQPLPEWVDRLAEAAAGFLDRDTPKFVSVAVDNALAEYHAYRKAKGE